MNKVAMSSEVAERRRLATIRMKIREIEAMERVGRTDWAPKGEKERLKALLEGK